MNCKNCGKRIRSYRDWRGEQSWTHEDQMIGRWCWLKAATPEEPLKVKRTPKTAVTRM